MRARLVPAAIVLSVASFGASPARAETVLVDGVAAVVGDTPILLSSVSAKVRPLLPEIQRRAQPAMVPALVAAAQKDVLAALVDAELIRRAAGDAGISVSDQEIERAMDSVASQNKMTRKELMLHVEDTGMTEAEYRVEVGRQMLEYKMLTMVVAPKLRITEDDVKARFAALHAADPARVPELEAARVAITEKLRAEALEKGRKAWLDRLRAVTYVEVRI